MPSPLAGSRSLSLTTDAPNPGSHTQKKSFATAFWVLSKTLLMTTATRKWPRETIQFLGDSILDVA